MHWKLPGFFWNNMSNIRKDETGAIIQTYVRARMKGPATGAVRDEAAESLPGSLLQRIDALGVDQERLLRVAPEDVTATLATLEREAELEDAGIRPRSLEVRAREERWIHGRTHSPDESSRTLRRGSTGNRAGRGKTARSRK